MIVRWFCFLLFFYSLTLTANNIVNLRPYASAPYYRLVFDLDSSFEFDYYFLDSTRLALNFVNFKPSASFLKTIETYPKFFLKALQNGSDYQLILSFLGDARPKIYPLSRDQFSNYRLVLDFPVSSNVATYFNSKGALIIDDVKSKKDVTPVAEKTELPKPKPLSKQKIVVVIDPGHGGKDPGAIGPKGNYEKKIVLAISKKLGAILSKEPNIKVLLTRTDDFFVDLNVRTEIAREVGASVFVSIHADSHPKKNPSGVSTWVLSLNRANREMGVWLEDQDKQQQLLGGVGDLVSSRTLSNELTRTFLDLSMDRVRAQSYELSEFILTSFKKNKFKLHRSEPEYASLAVLKSPDIPSVLIETGFISNQKEEAQLLSSNYQNRVARSVAAGIISFLKKYPNVYLKTYIVKKGDSLSILAARFDLLIEDIKSYNKLASNSLNVGQILYLPASNDLSKANKTTEKVAKVEIKKTSAPFHNVKSGDTLFHIAQEYNLSVAELRRLNRLKTDVLFVGQTLYFKQNPELKKALLAKKKKLFDLVYIVKSDDSLSEIAEKFNVSIDSIMKGNQLKKHKIFLGQRLILSFPYSKLNRYRVRNGDNISSLAKRFNVSAASIRLYNDLTRNTLFVDESLIILKR